MLLINKPNGNYTARQLKLPLEIEKLIDICDPVYTFCEVMDHIAVYDAQRSPFCFRTAVFRSQRPPIFS